MNSLQYFFTSTCFLNLDLEITCRKRFLFRPFNFDRMMSSFPVSINKWNHSMVVAIKRSLEWKMIMIKRLYRHYAIFNSVWFAWYILYLKFRYFRRLGGRERDLSMLPTLSTMTTSFFNRCWSALNWKWYDYKCSFYLKL